MSWAVVAFIMYTGFVMFLAAGLEDRSDGAGHLTGAVIFIIGGLLAAGVWLAKSL